MAREVNIGGTGQLFVGEDKIIRLEVLDPTGITPVNIGGWGITFVVRLKDNTPDPAIITKAAVITGVYAATRATNTQRAVVTLTDDDTNALSAKTYRYSLKRIDDGSETVLVWGNFAPQKATAL